MKQFLAMVYARTMEFVRDKGTFFWNLLFPVILVFGFAFAFSGSGNALFKVGVFGAPDPAVSFMSIEQIDFIHYDAAAPETSLEKVLDKLRRHELAMVVDFGSHSYYLNSQAKDASLLRRLFLSDPLAGSFEERAVSGAPVRYVDWLVPGVIGMNIMFSCLFGIGFVIVRYRKNGVLRRLRATPVSAFAFVSAQTLSRFIIVIITSVAVFAGTNAFLKFMMKGSYANLLAIASLGILSMLALGLVFASRFKSEELAGGIINVLTMPMLALSGVFFSLEGSPPVLRTIASFFPLTHLIQGARSIMIEGAGLAQIAPDLAFLGLFSLACLGIGAFLFKWE